MFGFVQNLFSQPTNPIGVDFGSDCLRMAQVQQVGDDYRLIAAASADVPSNLRDDWQARLEFFSRGARELMAHAPFRGRQAVIGLPASVTHITEIRLPFMDEAELKRIIPGKLAGRFPFDAADAVLRHMIAGDIGDGPDRLCEVIVMGAPKKWINEFLAAAAKAGLDVIGMNVEPMAIVDCFSHVFRRRSEEALAEFFVDMGRTGTRGIIAQSGKVRLVRNFPIGGDDFTDAVASANNTANENARTLRIKLASAAQSRAARAAMAQATTLIAPRPGQSAEAALGLECPREEAQQADQVHQACRPVAARLIAELNQCRIYYEQTFSRPPVDRMIFIGGEARQRALCQHIAAEMDLTAQLGDPLCRMSRFSEVNIESGIDRRTPQPAWTVAIGLSLGAIPVIAGKS
jgi:type IV pilus assembly protein PilM